LTGAVRSIASVDELKVDCFCAVFEDKERSVDLAGGGKA